MERLESSSDGSPALGAPARHCCTIAGCCRACEPRVQGLWALRHQVRAHLVGRGAGADADELVADTYRIAWRRLDRAPAGQAGLPWLCAIAGYVLALHRRACEPRWATGRRAPDEPLLGTHA